MSPLTLSLPVVPLIDFTLSNGRRFYSSMGNPTGLKGLIHILVGRAWHQHRRAIGSIPVEAPWIFQVSIRDNCFNCPAKCKYHFSLLSLPPPPPSHVKYKLTFISSHKPENISDGSDSSEMKTQQAVEYFHWIAKSSLWHHHNYHLRNSRCINPFAPN